MSVAVAFVGARPSRREGGVMKETDAKEAKPSIAQYNILHRPAAHMDPRFCRQGPTQMERGDPSLFYNIV